MYTLSTRSNNDVLTKPCLEGKSSCMRRPQGVKGEYFFMYVYIISNLVVWLLFTIIEVDILKVVNVAPHNFTQIISLLYGDSKSLVAPLGLNLLLVFFPL